MEYASAVFPSLSCKNRHLNPCNIPYFPYVMLAALSPSFVPRPSASTPYSLTDSSFMNPSNIPIAFEPPPIQAATWSGSFPVFSKNCARASIPITDWKCSTIIGNGCGPTTEPNAKSACSSSLEYAKSAASTASFNVFVPSLTLMMFAPRIFIFSTFGLCFFISTSPM